MVTRRIVSRWILAGTILAILIAVGAASALTLRDSERGPRDTTWERIQAQGVLVIGIDPSLPPFGEFSGDTVDGLDPALGRALADELGVRVRFAPLGYDGLYDSLLLGHVDVIIAALRPDPMRTDRIRYTSAYFDAGQVLVSLDGVGQLDSLAGQAVAVEFASEGDLAARDVEGLEIERYFTAEEALNSVRNQENTATVVDRVAAALYGEGLQIAPQRIVPDPYVLALRRNDWRLYRYLEEALQTLRLNGRLDAIIAEWVGPEHPE